MSRSIVVEGLDTTCKITVLPGERGPEIDNEIFDRLAAAWSRARVEDDVAAPQEVQLSLVGSPRPDKEIVTGSSIDALLSSTTQAVTRKLIGEGIGRLLMLHAGSLAHPETGDAIAFVAAGGTGKTTLANRLGQRYSYLTDETCGIDEDLVIHPYMKPLSIRGEGPHKIETSPGSLGLLTPTVTPHLVSIVILDRQEQHDGLTITELPLLEAIEELAPQTSSMHRLPDPLHLVARIIDQVDGIQKLTYSENEVLTQLFEERLGALE